MRWLLPGGRHCRLLRRQIRMGSHSRGRLPEHYGENRRWPGDPNPSGAGRGGAAARSRATGRAAPAGVRGGRRQGCGCRAGGEPEARGRPLCGAALTGGGGGPAPRRSQCLSGEAGGGGTRRLGGGGPFPLVRFSWVPWKP